MLFFLLRYYWFFWMNVPICMVRFDRYHVAFYIVYVIFVLFQCHGDDGDINFFVDTSSLQTVFKDNLSLMSGFGNLFTCFHSCLDRLNLAGFLMACLCAINRPNILKNTYSSARQENTMPIDRTVIPNPCGSSLSVWQSLSHLRGCNFQFRVLRSLTF